MKMMGPQMGEMDESSKERASFELEGPENKIATRACARSKCST
jgi:hypothetical protein